jgi:hypothetical protein
MDWINLTQDTHQGQDLMNTAMNFRVSKNVGNLWTS